VCGIRRSALRKAGVGVSHLDERQGGEHQQDGHNGKFTQPGAFELAYEMHENLAVAESITPQSFVEQYLR
jgi:hypothetical protein